MKIIIVSYIIAILIVVVVTVVTLYLYYRSSTVKNNYGMGDFKTFLLYYNDYEKKIHDNADTIDEDGYTYHLKYSYDDGIETMKTDDLGFEYTIRTVNLLEIEFEEGNMLLSFPTYIRFLFWYFNKIHKMYHSTNENNYDENLFKSIEE